jgi:two-component system sensor histidine kinase KdpD
MLVDTAPEPRRKMRNQENGKVLEWTKYLVSVLVVSATTFLSYVFFQTLGFTNIIMVMLLPVLLVSYYGGRSQGIWASFLSVVALDFFFAKPKFSFAISDIRYLPIFIVFFIVGATTSILSDLVKWRIDRYRKQEKFLNTIYNFSKELLTHNFLNEILGSITKNVGDFFKSDVVVLLPGKEDTVKIMASTERSIAFGENEIGISQWVYKNSKTAGKGTNTLSSSQWYYIPMSANNSVIGVISIYKRERDVFFTKEESEYLDSFANIAAMSLSRALSMSSYMDYVLKSL